MSANMILSGVQIRRSNGQCGYGPWMTADEVDSWVAEAIADEMIEDKTTSGEVNIGGELWLYRTV